MFPNIFGRTTTTTTTVELDVKNSLIRNTLKSNTNIVKKMIAEHNVNVNSNNLTDDYDQNLLHISVKTKNYELAQHLVGIGINKNKKNMLYESPFDIAMKNGDQKMLEILFEGESNSIFKIENARLIDRVSDLETNNKKLIDTNKELTIKNGALHIQLDDQIKSRKRKFDECDSYCLENKKLKVEITQLKADNVTLQETIKNLRESMKK